MRDDIVEIKLVVTFVLKLIDDYDVGEPKGRITFSYNDLEVKPIKKRGGLYIFTNLEMQEFEETVSGVMKKDV